MSYNITIESKLENKGIKFYISETHVVDSNAIVFGINEDSFFALEYADNEVDKMVAMVKCDFKPSYYKVRKVKVKKERY